MQNEFFEKVGQILEQARSNAKIAVNLSMVYAGHNANVDNPK